jgi:hypothetical protein
LTADLGQSKLFSGLKIYLAIYNLFIKKVPRGYGSHFFVFFIKFFGEMGNAKRNELGIMHHFWRGQAMLRNRVVLNV